VKQKTAAMSRAKPNVQETHWLRRSLPNAVTMAAMAAGMTAVPLAVGGDISRAVGCILIAALLDACDGRVARYLGTASKFGTELDSLSDVICFGAVPALVLYLWGLQDHGAAGWAAALALAVATALRLARFNVASQEKHRPLWWAAFFQGVPAPAGAFLALFPVYLAAGDILSGDVSQRFALAWVPLVAILMVSKIPTFSGKLVGRVVWRGPALLLLASCACALLIMLFGIWSGFVGMVVGYMALLPLSRWRFTRLSHRG
jgi:CDP-diacylglycerol---serine O-phosphatidyltransferase